MRIRDPAWCAAGLGAVDAGPGGVPPGAGERVELCQPAQHCHRQAGDGQVCPGKS